MQYLLLLHASESGWEATSEEQKKQGYAAYTAYTEALKRPMSTSEATGSNPSRQQPQ
jgi:hypothetical protein